MTKTNEILLPCPWCGNKPKTNFLRSIVGNIATVACFNTDCLTRDPIIIEKSSMKLAIKCWNTRQPAKLSVDKIVLLMSERHSGNYDEAFNMAIDIINAYNSGKLWEDGK